MKILIVDDDKFVASSLKTILEISGEVEVVALGNSGEEAIALYAEYKPEILLMDIRMEPMSGLEAGAKILGNDPDAKILYLTTFSDDEYIVKALSIGAKGYLLKQDFDSILPSIKAISTGQSVFGGEIVAKIPNLMKKEETFSFSSYNITEKEAELMKLVADGLSNKEIADTLFLSEGTVRNYLSVLLEKLQLRDRTQLACFYYQHL